MSGGGGGGACGRLCCCILRTETVSKGGAELGTKAKNIRKKTQRKLLFVKEGGEGDNSATALLDVCRRCFAGQWSLRQQRRPLGKESEGHSKASKEDI